MRRIAILAFAVAALGTGAAVYAATPTGTSLRITYWEDSSKPDASVTWTLRCNPPRGSLPRRAAACRRLAASTPKLFAPIPRDTVCTEIYGGPQRARIVGTVRGKWVWATLTRTNGCQIGRWNQLSPWLLPPGGVTRQYLAQDRNPLAQIPLAQKS